MPVLALSTSKPAEVDADVLVVGTVSSADAVDLAPGVELPQDAVAHIVNALEMYDAKGKADEVIRLLQVPGIAAKSVILTGLGDQHPTPGVLRDAAGAALRSVPKAAHVAVALPAADADQLAATASGAYAGMYSFTEFKSTAAKEDPKAAKKRGKKIDERSVSVVNSTIADAASVIEHAEIVARARAWAQDLVNTPPNVLYPASFADAVKQRVDGSPGKVKVSILDEGDLAKGGFGGLTAVGGGSTHKPRLVTLSYQPSKPTAAVAFVGKGITFDSGGLNLKPSAGMLTMKCDMAGAAAVAAAVIAAAELKLPVAVTGYLCLAENLPGSESYRPSDVLTMHNGKTVEVADTDAEGRLVLSDGLCLASEAKPDVIIDIATLTGAAMVSLGTRIAAVMSNDDTLAASARAAGARCGEELWHLPLPKQLRATLDSPVADMKNVGERWGGAMTAGLFLQEFVADGITWAHLDIAGPAYNDSAPHGSTAKGGTGFGVATLVSLAANYAK